MPTGQSQLNPASQQDGSSAEPFAAGSVDLAGRAAGALLSLCVVAGLGAEYHALEAAAGRNMMAESFAADPRAIRGALLLGGLSLLISLSLCLRSIWRKDGVPAPATALRVLFEILILGAAFYLIYLQPFKRATFDVTLGLAFGVWGLLLLAFLTTRRTVAAAPIRAADLILFNLCLFAILAEGGLRLIARHSASPVLIQADLKTIEIIEKRKQRYPPGRLRFGFPLNSLSHYDTEFDRPRGGGRRIALVGDSFSFGIVPHYFHFSTVGERVSGIEIDNFGYPGIGPLEYLYLLRQEILPLEPDAVAVNVFVGNDIGGARRLRARKNRPLRMWFDRDNLLLYHVPRRLARIRQQRRAGSDQTPAGDLQGEGSARRLDTVEEMIAAYPWLADSSREKPSILPKKKYLGIESRRAGEVCDPSGLESTELFEILREMRRVAGRTPFAVHIIPDEFQLDNELWKIVLERTGKPGLVRDLPQQRISEWLNRERIPFLDLLPVLRAQCAPHRRGTGHCYHLQDTHFNARGNRVAGEAMARFLTRVLEP